MELSLDSSSYEFVPKTISDFVAGISAIDESSEKLLKLDSYISRLEEERRKIEAFKRELPLSVLLVNDAIKRLKDEERVIRDCAIEEFMALNKKKKKKGKSFVGEDEIGRANPERDFSDKRSWMSSVQLWGSNVDFDLKPRRGDEEEDDRRVEAAGQDGNYKDRGGAFVSFKARVSSSSSSSGSQIIPSLSLKPPISCELGGSSSTTTKSNSVSNPKNNNNNGFRGCSGSTSAFLTQQAKLVAKPQPQQHQHQQNQHALRKQRRCWSPELHRRFVDALQHLGGSQATPKQIRDLMQVDGLTNDEVKSHLQKYRLHVRKLPNGGGAAAGQGNGGGGLWTNQQQEDQSEDNSKENTSVSQSGSPLGPLLANGSCGKALSNTGGESTEAEDDERSDGHSWRGLGGNNNHKEGRFEA